LDGARRIRLGHHSSSFFNVNAFATGDILQALLVAIAHYFEHGRWGSPVETPVEEQRLTAEDQLFILMQAEQHLTTIRGAGAPETGLCYECAKSLLAVALSSAACLGYGERNSAEVDRLA
jgi:hypothetical protein